MIATPSPAPTPSAASALASAFERLCICSKVTGPSSSISISRSGLLIAATLIPAAGEAPQRRSSRATRMSRSGRIGLITPAWARAPRLKGRSGSGPSGPSLILRSAEDA